MRHVIFVIAAAVLFVISAPAAAQDLWLNMRRRWSPATTTCDLRQGPMTFEQIKSERRLAGDRAAEATC